jgi:PadR family transcriptional regulator, regulatory protein PadR
VNCAYSDNVFCFSHYSVIRATVCNGKEVMDSTQLLKGVLDVAVLAVIDGEDGYGYDIVRRLRAAGMDDIGDASVYGTLRRLYAAGALTTYAVASEDGPHRKYYGINEVGRRMLAEQRATWKSFSDTMTTLLAPRTTRSTQKNGDKS